MYDYPNKIFSTVVILNVVFVDITVQRAKNLSIKIFISLVP